jgi:hypothetical protein
MAMAKWVVEIIGWIGALLILGSYGLMTMRRITAESATYQWMNLLGAVGLTVNGVWNGAFPSAFLNVVWLGIAGYALARSHRVLQRSPP